MQVTGIANPQIFSSVSVLRLANKEPQLAGELISKTVEGLMQGQVAQSPAQPASVGGMPQTGTIINTTA